MGRRRLKMRTLLLLVLLLAGGAIINIDVAWGIMLTPNHDSSFQVDKGDNYGDFTVIMSGGNGSNAVSVHRGEIRISELRGLSIYHGSRVIGNDRYFTLLPSWSRFSDQESVNAIFNKYRNHGDVFVYVEQGVGWPVLSLRSRYLCVYSLSGAMSQPRVLATELLGAPLRTGPWADDFAVPVRPIWAGFAINTLLYAAMLWTLLKPLMAMRRWRRTKRGLCPKCAYPVGSSDTCTECGRAVRDIRSGMHGARGATGQPAG